MQPLPAGEAGRGVRLAAERQGERDSYCRPCRAEYKRWHYAQNRARYSQQASSRNRKVLHERMEFILEYLATHPCTDCGESDILVLEFDHLRDKEFDIGYGIRNRKWASVWKEIQKCEVVCVNCHKRRTARRAARFKVLPSAGDDLLTG